MSPSRHAVAADHVFDGDTLHANAAVVIEDATIRGLVAREELGSSTPVQALPKGAWLAPGFIDLQVNGGGDVLFNDDPTPEGIAAIANAHRAFGTTSLLPTLITDSIETMERAFAAVQAAVEQNPSVLGIHFEGPFLSPQKPGVHSAEKIRKPGPREWALLTQPRRGALLVTLAPEEVRPGFIRALTGEGVVVSLGHSMATYAQTLAAIAEGLSGVTHLFNAMPPLQGREPGLVAAALESPDVTFGMIVDGLHVDPAMLRLALRGAAQPMLVTDAMPPVGGVKPNFTLYGEMIEVSHGRCARPDGKLAGSMLTMAEAVRNCVAMLGVPLTAALQFASHAPARFIGAGGTLGSLAPGYRADMVAFEPETMNVLATWVAGQQPTKVPV